MVASPQNNKHISEKKKYNGVGGHLFAIAAQKSQDYGYDCEMVGIATMMPKVKGKILQR